MFVIKLKFILLYISENTFVRIFKINNRLMVLLGSRDKGQHQFILGYTAVFANNY